MEEGPDSERAADLSVVVPAQMVREYLDRLQWLR